MRRLSLLSLITMLAVTTAPALANSGDDQYCDPFSGCGNNTPTTTPHKPVKQRRHQSSSKQVDNQPTGQSQTQLRSHEVTAARQYVAQLPTKAIKFKQSDGHKQRLADARHVLRAAGLDSLYPFYL